MHDIQVFRTTRKKYVYVLSLVGITRQPMSHEGQRAQFSQGAHDWHTQALGSCVVGRGGHEASRSDTSPQGRGDPWSNTASLECYFNNLADHKI